MKARLRKNWDPLILLVGNVKWYNHFGKQFCSSSKVKSSLAVWPYDTAIGPLDLFSKKLKYMFTHTFTVALFKIGKKQKQHKHLLTDECINKMWYYPQNGILYSNKTSKVLIHIKQINLENMLSEVNQTWKDNYFRISLTWNTCNRQVQRKSRLENIRSWEKEEWGIITSNGYRVSIWDYEKFWK